ncbi:metal-dependent membrane protease [Streptococcus varani]|uniref:Metal-dependent membrane protease n=1 Tax=Streptococcus varani TaxID=1608583 RepID=A0A0E4CRS6_9STRE|nr:CPBP family intramembrane glutamic endopeptidase [Streptococcus varani]CQR23831.1 metal-dependent membrane protease [Streptococcus varani]
MKYKLAVEPILFSLGLITLASLIYVMGTSMLFVFSIGNIESTYLLALLLFMPIGFIVLPLLLAKRQFSEMKISDVQWDWRQYISLAFLIFLLNHFFIHSDEYFHQMVISICEEVLFRYIIYRLIRENYNYVMAILISAVLFGFVLHLNYPVYDNLFIRTPLGILFSIFATKIGLHYAVAGHWIYNLVVSRIPF